MEAMTEPDSHQKINGAFDFWGRPTCSRCASWHQCEVDCGAGGKGECLSRRDGKLLYEDECCERFVLHGDFDPEQVFTTALTDSPAQP